MPPRRPGRPQPEAPEDLEDVAERCDYVGSEEHKDQRWWQGMPWPRNHPRDVATICSLVTERDRDQATEWIREAIKNGQFGRKDWRNGFPRRVWHRDRHGQYWYGMLTNQGAGPNPRGQYKGWPIGEDEKVEIFG